VGRIAQAKLLSMGRPLSGGFPVFLAQRARHQGRIFLGHRVSPKIGCRRKVKQPGFLHTLFGFHSLPPFHRKTAHRFGRFFCFCFLIGFLTYRFCGGSLGRVSPPHILLQMGIGNGTAAFGRFFRFWVNGGLPKSCRRKDNRSGFLHTGFVIVRDR
jgi:hypothetical protein